MALAGLNENIVRQIHAPLRPRPRGGSDRATARGAGHPPGTGEEEDVDSLLLNRLTSCEPLLHAVRVAAKVLQEAAQGLRRSTESIQADATFRRQLEARVPPMARTSREMIESFNCIGVALTDVAQTLSCNVLQPLEEMKLRIKEDCIGQHRQLKQLEQQERLCSQAVSESTQRKEKASAEVQAALEQEAKKGWLSMSPAARSPQGQGPKLEAAAARQTAAVEELAAKMDEAADLKLRKEKGITSFQELLGEVDERCDTLLRSLTGQCGSAWADVAQQLQSVAEKLQKAHGTAIPSKFQGGAQQRQPSRPRTPRASEGAAASADDYKDVQVVYTPQEVASDIAVPVQREASPDTVDVSAITVLTEEPSTAAAGPLAAGGAADSEVPPAPASAQAQAVAAQGQSLVLHFGEHVKRLGFEVLWETERPSVGSVVPDGEADRAGLISGAVLTSINGVETRGKARPELMPLLKVRPLELVLDLGRTQTQSDAGVAA